jgi:hypothetical protein
MNMSTSDPWGPLHREAVQRSTLRRDDRAVSSPK